MAWTTISNALVAVGAKPFATTIQALRDNPVAIAAGDPGAPRVDLPAIVDALAAPPFGTLGSYALLRHGSVNTAIVAGTTYAGSALRISGFYGTVNSTCILGDGATAPSGTWRCLGSQAAIASNFSVAIFLRIS